MYDHRFGAYVEGPVCFCFEISGPRDALILDADVYVDPPPSAPPTDAQWLVFGLPETEHASERSAVTALADAVAALRAESERREPTPEAWLPT